MGFPFIAPLKTTIVTKLKEREKNQQLSSLLSPFAILSSAALVTKTKSGTEIKSIIKDQKWPTDAYYGCVISNSTEVKNMYQTGKTIAGYDLNGKPIVVEGEENRRVSLPIITDIEIDTDGNNNTLKTAKVNVKVFTLKQLEMFELFFLRPSMDVVLEFGYNTDIRGKYYNNIEQYLFVGKGYKHWEEKFIKQFSHKENAYRDAKIKYLDILEKTNYEYDFFAGKLLNFNFTPDVDGTYNVSLEISAGNELQQWMPLKQASPVGETQKAKLPKVEAYEQWMSTIAADINLPKLKGLFKKEYIKSELFNWATINKDEKDTNFSKDRYISFQFIIDILNKSKLFNNQKNQITSYFNYIENNNIIPIIPISSDKNIISTNTVFILPGDLPEIFVADIGKIVLDETKRRICKINDKSFNITSKEIRQTDITKDTPNNGIVDMGNITIGNLYNVFIEYETFVRVFNQAYTQADIINELLSYINMNMFGLCKLELSKEDDTQNGGALTIIDRKLRNIFPSQKPEEIYRFKIGASGSIVKEFNFNFEMSELMQGQSMFATEYDILNLLTKKETDNTRIVSETEVYSSADLSFVPNADGYCSINKVGVALVNEALEWNQIISASLAGTGTVPVNSTEEKTINLKDYLKGQLVSFKLNSDEKQNADKALNHLIYKDPALVQQYIPKSQKGTTVLTFLDITLSIDGMSGLSCGEYFNIDGVPEIYNKNGYFQITNVKQGLNENEWKTTIEASYLLKAPEDIETSNKKEEGKSYTKSELSNTKTIKQLTDVEKTAEYIKLLTTKKLNEEAAFRKKLETQPGQLEPKILQEGRRKAETIQAAENIQSILNQNKLKF